MNAYGVSYVFPVRYLLGEIEAQLDELEGCEDINDNGGPNEAMRLAETLRQCRLYVVERLKEPA